MLSNVISSKVLKLNFSLLSLLTLHATLKLLLGLE